jgi:tetraacyldisaccharide 4'-kinase
MIARKLQAPVIVGADRYRAGLLAEQKFSTKLHLLDDGFQHRRLHRDFDIVLLPAEDLTGSLLPVGRLREPISSLCRTDAAVVFEQPAQSLKAKRIWSAQRRVELSPIGGWPVAFCGIARPEQFFGSLEALGQKIALTMTFTDHYSYRELDIDDLLRLKNQTGADGFLTTEKDAINLGSLSTQLQPLRLAQLRIELESPEQVLRELIKTIEQRSGQQIQPPA